MLNSNNKASVNHNTPAQIRKRITSLRKQVKRQEKINKLLREEQFLKDRLNMNLGV